MAGSFLTTTKTSSKTSTTAASAGRSFRGPGRRSKLAFISRWRGCCLSYSTSSSALNLRIPHHERGASFLRGGGVFALIVQVLSRVLSPSTQRDCASALVAAAVAAAFFAVHPLRVEVVAWASCQPDLPCAFFSVLAVMAYLRAFDRDGRRHFGWLAASWFLFLAAELSKAVAVTLPVVLVVVDLAILRRLGRGRWAGALVRQVWREKMPFFAISVLFLFLAILAKQSNDSLISIQDYGVIARVAQACYGTAFYLAKTVWPVGLAAYYPLPRPSTRLMTAPYVFGIPTILLATAVSVILGRRRPAVLASWVVFLIILAPNMGLMRIGDQIAADRYSYVASMPLYVVFGAGIYCLVGWAHHRRVRLVALAAVGATILFALCGLSWQLSHTWRDTGALWANNARQGYLNSTVRSYLGMVAEGQGDFEEAKNQYRRALRSDPNCSDAYNLLGAVLDREGRHEEAMAHFLAALRIEPKYAAAQNNVGSALARQGRLDEAIVRFTEAVKIKPDFVLARKNLAKALRKPGVCGRRCRTSVRRHGSRRTMRARERLRARPRPGWAARACRD